MNIIKNTLFQFHKGTIRTPKFLEGFAWLNYFNSIKVRLEQYLRRYSSFLCIISIP